MSRSTDTLPAEYFDRLYAQSDDPWHFATSAYERQKYARTLSALPRDRYGKALEVGCSIGVLTNSLAWRCEQLHAIDGSAAPLAMARQRCAEQPWVTFDQMFVPGQWPAGLFDVILLSEVVYYLVPADIGHLVQRTEHALAENGDVLLVHWTGVTNYPLSGDDAAEIFITDASPFAQVVRQERAEAFRLDLLTRR